MLFPDARGVTFFLLLDTPLLCVNSKGFKNDLYAPTKPRGGGMIFVLRFGGGGLALRARASLAGGMVGGFCMVLWDCSGFLLLM